VVRPALATAAIITVAAMTGAARADETSLADPATAVAFLLAPREAEAPAEARPRWDGSLGEGIVRTLFGFYRTVIASQDMPMCGFSPSCSRFSQRAVAQCGFVQGTLLSIDRLIRDHPLAAGLYRVEEGGRLLLDEPGRYCLTAFR
jgi:putative component of membrane protein insertase Oxa1/YidC/SpoIIIJ protein YidD